MTHHFTPVALAPLGRTYDELMATILRGWPVTEEVPDEQEALMIESAYHELCVHLPEVTSDHAWRIAGAVVNRFRRDVGEPVSDGAGRDG